MTKEAFEAQPITLTILCPSCSERLLFGVTVCRFCQTAIDKSYAEASVQEQAVITDAVKSANILRTLGKAAYICLAATVFAFFFDRPYLELLLIISFGNLIAAISWLRKYRAHDHPEVVTAAKQVRINLYLWIGAMVLQVIAVLVWIVGW